jgi:16S rRNA (cytidine1402-2'-O)-methyltransferase
MDDDSTNPGDDGAAKGNGGVLWVVATPIGNLGDCSERAIDVLRHVDLIIAEDTRVTRRLLDAHGIASPLQSFHEHNEQQRAEPLVARLERGARLALVSDAGTPLLSDPGYQLVRCAQEHNVAVRVVPGPSAITAALSVSGLPTRPFWFEGFLPARASARRRRLRELSTLRGTLVFFEAPHRVRECLADMVTELGAEREAAFARELSKRFEEVRRDSLGSLVAWFERNSPRGEFVLLVHGAPATSIDRDQLTHVLECLLDVLPTRQAAAAAARITGARRNDAYALALTLKADN